MEKILHINSYYVDTHLYSKIYKKIGEFYQQEVYIPIKNNRSEDNKMDIINTRLNYSKIISKSHSIFYFNKIKILTDDLISKKLHENIKIIHAHNLFIDGAVAYNLKKKYGIDYVVSIRMTDINLQYKYMFHRRSFALKILKEAKHIIFISPLYKEVFWKMIGDKNSRLLEDKTSILPNGIDDFWLNNTINKTDYYKEDTFNLIYIGQIIQRKNLHRIINAIDKIGDKNIKLTIVGGENLAEKKYYEDIMTIISTRDNIQYEGVVKNMLKLQDLLSKSHALIMPSVNELFGLVYIEALSQNTPVIYPLGEGITPYLENKNVGIAVNPNDDDSILNSILEIRDRYSEFNDLVDFSINFNWNTITQNYIEIYKTIYE